ncbi:MAG: metallophosphoesterase [Pseudomonadota bacterium]
MSRPLRRILLLLALVLAAVAAALGWGFLIEPGLLSVARYDIASPHWPPDAPPLRIALIGDLHAGAPFIDLDKVARVVALTNAENPDLIVLLGDYVIQRVPGGRPIPIEATASVLGGLRAPLGTIAVLGNHDWWGDGGRIRAELERAGITVLENQAVRREFHGRAVWIAGVADAMTRHVDMTAALAPTGSEPTIVLSHNPRTFAALPCGPRIMLAAHTHGGQVRLPLIGALITARDVPHRWMFGHIVEDCREMFVTTGIGTSILPVRFLTPPVIDVLTLRAQR